MYTEQNVCVCVGGGGGWGGGLGWGGGGGNDKRDSTRQTKIHLISKQVQNGTLYKENNDVAKGFIGCHVISIMIVPVQYAFFGPVHSLPVAWGCTIRKIFSCYNVMPAVPKGTI